ncbi:MAG: DNRLRE domain-containing protein [Verrucomicrobiales bacterium]|nr:DNRLRE domain-containing protein [Verrucomicrobiales bacterium]
MLRFLFPWFLLLAVSFTRADEYDDLRLKWRDLIAGAGYNVADPDVVSKLNGIDNGANTQWATMDTSPTRTFLWSDLASTTNSAHVTRSYQRLRQMALAYATTGCSLEGDAALLADLLSALDWMNANRYNATTTQYGNWWDWEIGSPLALTDLCTLIYDDLSPAQLTAYMNAVNHQTPTPDMTQANQVWKARVVGVRGCLVKSSAKIALCRDAFSDVFPYVTSGDGFYTDGSFIQHNVHPYTAGYGSSLLDNMAPVLRWLSGSTWAVTDPAQANLFHWVFDSYEPIIFRGHTFDLVRGREAGRSGASTSSHGMMDSLLQIAQFAPAEEALRMKRMIKHWALTDDRRDFVAGRGLDTLALAQDLMGDGAIVARDELLAHHSFASMDRVIHLGEGYGFGLSMCSTRVANFESINGENLQGWFTGDGQTLLYNADLTAFDDAYQATVDAHRRPGVTADVTHNKLPHQSSSLGPRAQGQSTLSPHAWVGGATLGRYGAAGMQFKGVGVSLTGKKSWFMFDDEIVCLGAGITSTDSRPIETTVEQRKLNAAGSNRLTLDGVVPPRTLGWSDTIPNAGWAHLAGNQEGADVGYVFPGGSALTAVREARTGAWGDIDSEGSTTPITRNYLRLTLNHGSNPSDAGYQYVLLPGHSASHTAHYAAAPDAMVLVNNSSVQAVRETTLGITAANFWTDTPSTVGGITVDRKACVLVRDDGVFVEVSVSDPTQLNTAGIDVGIAMDGGTLVAADAGVTVTQATPTIALQVATAGAAGRTFTARFFKGTPQMVTLSPVADAYVYDANPDTNYGGASALVVKKSGAGFNRESFLRFDLPSASGILLGGTLRLSAGTASTPGVHAVALVADTTWSETGITWNNQPTAGAVLSTWTPAASSESFANVTAGLPTSGLVSFKVYGQTQTSDGYVSYASRENGTAANRPQLALAYGHTPPEVRVTSPANGAAGLREGLATLTAEATATDGAVTEVAFYDGGTLLGSDTSAPYSITTPLAGGEHLLTAVATDANGLSRTSLVNWVVVNHAPEAMEASVGTDRDTPVETSLPPLASDVETAPSALRFTLGTAVHGAVAFTGGTPTARFTPDPGFTGAASFQYHVTDTTPHDHLLASYDFDLEDGTDASGHDLDGSFTVAGTGAMAFSSDVPLAGLAKSVALTENGTAGAARLEVSVSNSVLPLATADWTVAGWFKRSVAANIDVVAQIGASGSYGPGAMTLAFYNASDTLQLRHYTRANVNDVLISRSGVTPGMWHHFAIVRSGAAVTLYVDGAPAGSDTDWEPGFSNSSPVKFGGSQVETVTDRWLNGSLADLALFKAALDAGEVSQLSTTPVRWLGGQTTTATVSVQVRTPIESWRLLHFGTTENAGDAADLFDFDLDGRCNLLEYGTGTLPKVANASTTTLQPAGGGLEFFYRRNKAADDVLLTVEWSDTLAESDWSTAGVSAPALVSETSTTQQLKVTLPTALGVTRRFARLRVTRIAAE